MLVALIMSDIQVFMILLQIFIFLQQFQKCSRKGDSNGKLLFWEHVGVCNHHTLYTLYTQNLPLRGHFSLFFSPLRELHVKVILMHRRISGIERKNVRDIPNVPNHEKYVSTLWKYPYTVADVCPRLITETIFCRTFAWATPYLYQVSSQG